MISCTRLMNGCPPAGKACECLHQAGKLPPLLLSYRKINARQVERNKNLSCITMNTYKIQIRTALMLTGIIFENCSNCKENTVQGI